MLFKNKKEYELLSDIGSDYIEHLPVDLKDKINDHKVICDYLHNLYRTKNRDYGDSMHPLYEEFGLTAFLIMFSIKINRVKSLMQKGSATYESLEDSLMDLANYAIIAAVEMRAEKREEEINRVQANDEQSDDIE